MASASSRVICQRAAIISADSPCGTSLSPYRSSIPLPNGFCPMTFASIGTRVIDSTPAAIAMSYAPEMTPCAAKCAACCDEPHWRSTVVAGTDSGRPAPSHALRPMFSDCSPT